MNILNYSYVVLQYYRDVFILVTLRLVLVWTCLKHFFLV